MPKRTLSGRSRRMDTTVIEALIVRYAERALKAIPAESAAHEPAVFSPRSPMFWVSPVEYHRI